MPGYQPSSAQVHVNRPLTNMSVAYIQQASNFVATRAAPTVPVAKQSDRYFAYDRADFFRDDMKKRAFGAESAGSGYNIDNTPNYYADIWALHKDIPWALRDNQDMPLDMDRDASIYLTHQALIRKEKIFAAYMTTGVWTASGSDGTPGTKWDAANATPIKEMRAGITAVHAGTGYRPNRVVMGQAVWDVLADSSDLISRVNAGQTPGGPATVQASTLARILEVEQVLVMGGVESTSQEGAAADTFDFIGSSDTGVLVAYVANAPGIMQPSALYTFAWTGHLGANAEGGAISTFPLRQLKSDRVEIEMAIDMKLVSAELGYYINNVLT